MNWMTWYNSLAKPSWTPAPSTIGLIWSVLYPIIAVTFTLVFLRAYQAKIPWKIALPFAINLLANLMFMPLFSGLRSIELAAVDIVIVWGTIIWCIVAIWPHSRWIALAQVPYLIWVTIATILQLSIVYLNF